jgi:hypothetical protein
MPVARRMPFWAFRAVLAGMLPQIGAGVLFALQRLELVRFLVAWHAFAKHRRRRTHIDVAKTSSAIRVTKLPAHLESEIPLEFAEPDSLGMAVAMALQRRAAPFRVVHWVGQGADIRINKYDPPRGTETALFAEYSPFKQVAGLSHGLH